MVPIQVSPQPTTPVVQRFEEHKMNWHPLYAEQRKLENSLTAFTFSLVRIFAAKTKVAAEDDDEMAQLAAWAS